MSAFNLLIKARRRALKLTQAQVADAVGVTKTSVHLWETGKVEPNLLSALRVSGLLGISLDTLRPTVAVPDDDLADAREAVARAAAELAAARRQLADARLAQRRA